MFKKILIANRGEIACRVIKSARKMGIKTVAVYSEADRDALHAEMADEKVLIGPAPSAQSYLVMDRIIEACRQTGAEAVHPGYGFLSENATFCERLRKEGITFIGPDVPAITAMGDKIESKKLALNAKVNTVPGHTEAVRDPADAVKIADSIGYPVMLKASAGGGGKGMRIARSADEVAEGLRSATNEAKSSFGDDRVFIEKFIEKPRHIEIQILADGHGNAVYLNERECSIQRRHQKVIEEAPSPFLDPATRKAMGEQAVALAKAVDYRSAGTVEFIVDADKNFYFLEMNTRLQVEHPVTEFITGLDLVEWMIRIAAGDKLDFTQEDVRIDGWAMEARVYAEDPFRGFLPSTGRVVRYQPPEEGPTVRVDTGVYEGGEISMFYDPMIAKLITYGADRAQAIRNMQDALDAFHIRGVSHNISFLAALMAHPRFRDGDMSTNFIAEEYPDGFHDADVPHDDPKMLAAIAAAIHRKDADRRAAVSGRLMADTHKVSDSWVVVMGEARFDATVVATRGGFDVTVEGEAYPVRTDWRFGQPMFRADVRGQSVCVQLEHTEVGYRLFHSGSRVDALVLTPTGAELNALMPVKEAPDLSRFLMSPMPGLLVSVAVAEGDEIKAGEELAVVEAMKMENVLKATQDGVVSKIHAEPGASLAVDQIILEFE